MNQCLRIILMIVMSKKLLQNIQKKAKELELEGTVQTVAQPEGNVEVRIVVCGSKEAIDDFVDYLHAEVAEIATVSIEIEPFIKDKEYRGVFRIIE